jgi:flagellar hook-length control protein FliK
MTVEASRSAAVSFPLSAPVGRRSQEPQENDFGSLLEQNAAQGTSVPQPRPASQPELPREDRVQGSMGVLRRSPRAAERANNDHHRQDERVAADEGTSVKDAKAAQKPAHAEDCRSDETSSCEHEGGEAKTVEKTVETEAAIAEAVDPSLVAPPTDAAAIVAPETGEAALLALATQTLTTGTVVAEGGEEAVDIVTAVATETVAKTKAELLSAVTGVTAEPEGVTAAAPALADAAAEGLIDEKAILASAAEKVTDKPADKPLPEAKPEGDKALPQPAEKSWVADLKPNHGARPQHDAVPTPVVSSDAMRVALSSAPQSAPIVLPQPQTNQHAEAVATMRALPIEIGLSVLKGLKQFTIRLDPAELGKVEVKLSMDDEGKVQAKLTVDRVDTLYMLQRDAKTLERAFDQAGLKTSPDSLGFNLRDGSESRRQGEPQGESRSHRHHAHDEPGDAESILMRADIAQLRQIASAARGGIDRAI